jgi:hypothetical protein
MPARLKSKGGLEDGSAFPTKPTPYFVQYVEQRHSNVLAL